MSNAYERVKEWRKTHKRKREPGAYARGKRWWENNPVKRVEVSRRSKLKINFGITLEQYNAKLAEQQGGCAICGRSRHFDKLTQRLAVDHNHSTKTFRGLLCGPCNRGLGMFKDNPTRLRKAAEYLERTDATTTTG